MAQPLKISVTLSAADFSAFAWFDTFLRRGRWRMPALFAAAFTAFACVAFARADAGNQGVLLGCVLLAVGLGLPLVYLANYALSLRRQAKAMGLPRPVYNIELGGDGVTCYHTAGEGAAAFTPWAGVYGAWRRGDAVYLYPDAQHAYLLPDTGKPAAARRVWDCIAAHLPPEKLHHAK